MLRAIHKKGVKYMLKHKILLPSLLLALCAGLGAQTPQAPVSPATLSSLDETGELTVYVGKSILVNSPETLHRVSVTNSDIASATVVTPTQILIHGLKTGSVTLLLWDAQERPRSFNLTVEFDAASIRNSFQQTFPNEQIAVAQSGASLILSGSVSAKPVSDQAAALGATFGAGVVNMLQVVENRQVVLLQVKFAEVDRSAILNAGFNLFNTGAGNTIGAIGTQQFSPIGSKGELAEGNFGLSDLLNVFIFRPDLNLGATIKALQQKNVLQILAEPNVMALNGKEASFLAGGEFPFPVVQSSAQGNSVTIVFKEFGVRLNFLPQIQADGLIRLRVRPEVSSLDFANGLNVGGFLVPALSTRRAETEVELRDGQSFAIAGLMDNRLSDVGTRIPGLGNIPIIGYLFRSKAANKSNTELLVTVTPRLVQATSPAQLPPTPEFPKPFMNPDSFDGKPGQPPAKKGAGPAIPPTELQPQLTKPQRVPGK
jgi:pilus assembly protein CpaC